MASNEVVVSELYLGYLCMFFFFNKYGFNDTEEFLFLFEKYHYHYLLGWFGNRRPWKWILSSIMREKNTTPSLEDSILPW